MYELTHLPENAVVRRINELVKRARSVKVHAYIIHYLRKQMPYVMGKQDKQVRPTCFSCPTPPRPRSWTCHTQHPSRPKAPASMLAHQCSRIHEFIDPRIASVDTEHTVALIALGPRRIA